MFVQCLCFVVVMHLLCFCCVLVRFAVIVLRFGVILLCFWCVFDVNSTARSPNGLIIRQQRDPDARKPIPVSESAREP